VKVAQPHHRKDDRSAALTVLRGEYSTQFSANWAGAQGGGREIKIIQFAVPYSGKTLKSVAPVCANGSSVWHQTNAFGAVSMHILHNGRNRHVEE